MPDTISEATYHWTREKYDRAVEAGIFGPDDRLELIEGQLLATMPQGSRHAAIVGQAGDVLRDVFGADCSIRTQCPLAAGDDSEPEPDLAVVPGRARDYLDAHPTSALLVVEVSDDSLRRDRIVKQRGVRTPRHPPSTGSWPCPTPVWRSTAIRPPTDTAPP